MGRGVINKPLHEVADFLKTLENNLTWDKFLIVSRECPQEKYPGYRLGFMLEEFPLPFFYSKSTTLMK